MTEEKQKSKCNCCLVLGIILLAAGLLADVVGIGASTAFGPKQILACAAGVILILLGLRTCKVGCCKK